MSSCKVSSALCRPSPLASAGAISLAMGTNGPTYSSTNASKCASWPSSSCALATGRSVMSCTAGCWADVAEELVPGVSVTGVRRCQPLVAISMPSAGALSRTANRQGTARPGETCRSEIQAPDLCCCRKPVVTLPVNLAKPVFMPTIQPPGEPAPNTLLPLAMMVVITASLLALSSRADTDASASTNSLPGKLRCEAVQTAGLHDYDGAPERYEPSTFFESKFNLRINKVLTRHLAASNPGKAEATPDLFLTMLPSPSSQGTTSPVELRCRQVQGQNRELGYSCSNTPPSEMLLINPANLRFTRASIGGWTFGDSPSWADAEDTATGDPVSQPPNENAGEHLADDSLFVEFGSCERG